MEKIPDNIIKEIERLVKEINEHNYRYYVLDTPVISDEEYDKLFQTAARSLKKSITTSFPTHPRSASARRRSTSSKR